VEKLLGPHLGAGQLEGERVDRRKFWFCE